MEYFQLPGIPGRWALGVIIGIKKLIECFDLVKNHIDHEFTVNRRTHFAQVFIWINQKRFMQGSIMPELWQQQM